MTLDKIYEAVYIFGLVNLLAMFYGIYLVLDTLERPKPNVSN